MIDLTAVGRAFGLSQWMAESAGLLVILRRAHAAAAALTTAALRKRAAPCIVPLSNVRFLLCFDLSFFFFLSSSMYFYVFRLPLVSHSLATPAATDKLTTAILHTAPHQLSLEVPVVSMHYFHCSQ